MASIQGRQLPAFFLSAALGVFYCLGVTGGAATAQESSAPIARYEPSVVSVLGAVVKPVSVSGPVSLEDAIIAASGFTDQAYPYGAVLLRATNLLSSFAECLSREAELMALQLGMTGGASIGPLRHLKRRQESGKAIRLPVSLLPLQTGGTDQAEIILSNGDILFIPERPRTVAVVLPSESTTAFVNYRPGWKADDYIASVGGQTKWSSNAFSIYLPNGELRELKLSLWNYQPQVVPPGSVVISDDRNAGKLQKVCAGL